MTAVQAGPPVADRDDRGDRAGEGRARRGAAAGRRRDPQRRRRAGPPDGSRTDARVMTYGFAPDATSAPRRSSRAAPTGCAFDLVADGRAAAASRSRRSAGWRSTTRWPPRRSGSRAGFAARARSRRRSAAGWSAPHRGAARPGRRRDDRRRHLQRLAGVGRRGARPAGRDARPADRRPRRDARAGRRARGGPRAGRRGRGRGSSTGSSSSATGAAGIAPRRARRRACRRRASSRSADRAGGPGDAARATLAPGDVVLVKASRGDRPRPPRRRPRRGPRGPGTRDDRRADPGPAARLRDRRDPDAALHPAAPGDRLHEADPDRGPGQPPGQARHADDGRRR